MLIWHKGTNTCVKVLCMVFFIVVWQIFGEPKFKVDGKNYKMENKLKREIRSYFAHSD